MRELLEGLRRVRLQIQGVDVSQMIYAVVRRPYANYNNPNAEKLVRMFATWDEADEYIRDRVMVFRPSQVCKSDDCWIYEYGIPDTDTTISKADFPQYVIRPFYVEGQE